MKKVTIKDISIALEESIEDTLEISKKIGFSGKNENTEITIEEAIIIAMLFAEKEPEPIEKEIISEDKPKIYKHKKAVSISIIRKQKQ